jgi:hypothetical protein
MQASVALQLEDAKGQAHPDSERGPTHQEGKWSDYRINLACWVWAGTLLPPPKPFTIYIAAAALSWHSLFTDPAQKKSP